MPADWRLIACDVGQGTAVLLRTESAAVLVDTGPEDGGVIGCLQAADVTRLDAVVLTHHHADHVGDIRAVLRGRPVGQVIVGPGRYPEAGVELVMAAAAEHAVPVSTVAAGQQLAWPGLRSAVLWPRPTDRGSADDVNNSSLVLVSAWADGGTALTPGDVEPASQAAIMAAWRGPSVDVLVIPHHASDAQDPRFPSWSRPVLALASAGADNSYGHPAPETLAEYRQLGAAVARTDEAGSIACVWREGRLEVFT